ncbi:MAG: hypothetical protein K8J31_10950 [Anaerolineae bacterium]|nr:hypothetical protein [Anaerolineae bacterium]
MNRSHLTIALVVLALLIGTLPVALPQDATPVPLNANILTWAEAGSNPQESSPSTAGELGLMDGSGAFTKLLDVPAQTSRLEPCGNEAYAPDGSTFAFYMGLDSGTLYLMKGSDMPVPVAEVNALTCLGGGTFQFSPDSSRLAYIAYEPDAASSEFADGFLHVVNTADLSETYRYENVTAFDLAAGGMAFVSFFTNDRSEADEAAVFWWNGNAEREVATLRPDENCRYTSASITTAPDGSLLLVLGHRCRSGDTRTSWQLYRINVEDRSATLAASEFAEGQFASYTGTNQIMILPGGDAALFLVPDGVTANTAGVMVVQLADLSISEVIQRQAVYPTLSGAPNAFPVVSPDGRWLAVVVTSVNNDNTLNVIDLSAPATPPITLSAGSRNDLITTMAFSADSQRLIFIAGAAGLGRDAGNSLVALDLDSGSDFRIKRGHFARGFAIAPDGSAVAAMDYELPEDEREPAYLNLVKIDIDTSETTLLAEGADVVDGKVTNQRFAMPLSWRP